MMKFFYAILIACLGIVSVNATELSSEKDYKAVSRDGCFWAESATIEFPIVLGEKATPISDNTFLVLTVTREKAIKDFNRSVLAMRVTGSTDKMPVTCLPIGKYTAQVVVMQDNKLLDISNTVGFEIHTTQVAEPE